MRCEIITPVGPGHEQTVGEAVASVKQAWAYSQGPFTDLRIRLEDDTEGRLGRSKARNIAVSESDSDWLFFLDADDLMHPAGFGNLPPLIGYAKRGPVAVWGSIVEYREGLMLDRFQVPKITSYEQLIQFNPYHSIQIGHFVECSVAQRYPFDESMDTGEDWDYYLRVWRNERCEKIAKPLMVNRRGLHSEGPRAATGREWSETVSEMLRTAQEAA